MLRAGTYAGDFVCSLNGTQDNPIIVQPYENEHPIIDGKLSINGEYTEWNDLEIMYSGWIGREITPAGVEPLQTVDLNGKGIKLNRCIIHDTAGNGSWMGNVGGGFFDCLVYNCGWMSDGAGYGHGVYTQNEFATQYHHNNIFWGQYNYGIHAYTETGKIDYFDIRNNICFRNGGRQFDLGGLGGQRAHNCIVDGNVILEGDGYLKGNDIALTNNYSPNGFTVEETSVNVIQSGNTFDPDSLRVFVFGRHIAIFNPNGLDSVPAAVTGTIHNAQNYFNDIQVVDGVIDMRAISHTVIGRIGGGVVETTFPAFGAFVMDV